MIDDVVKYLKTKVDEFEVYYNKNNSLTAEIASDKISFVSEGVTHGVAVRVVVDGKFGFAYTSNLDNYKDCVDTALKVAKVSKKDENFKGFVKPKEFKIFKDLNKDVVNLTPELIHEFNNEFVSKVKAVDKNILYSIGMFSKDVSESRVVNSEGVDLDQVTAVNAMEGGLVIENKGRLEMLEFEMGSKNLLDVNVAKSHAQRLLGLLNKKQMKTSELPLIFHPEALASLFSQSYVFSVSGENLFMKKSKLKVGDKVFDDKITITDDAVTKGLFCTRPFDKEGTQSQKFNVIEKGVFKNALYDNYYGRLVGKESTGNAQRGVVYLPRIIPNNIVVKEGTKDVFKEVDKAIYVRGMLGVHTMNEATGDFSLGVLEGHYVENGEFKHAVKDTMVAGNFFEIMNNVVSIGKDIKHSLDVSGGCYMPEILFKNVKVIGT